MTYYKVLVDGKSCHGGDMGWSLPTRDEFETRIRKARYVVAKVREEA